ncbi:MAG: M28 family peptidase [Pedobacter sp.]|nr:MAG: M28 family peptidase [Pedobacter sp.]
MFLLPLAFLISCGSVKTTQNTAQNGDQLLKDVEVLASDAYEGRKTGTKGAEMARMYLTGRLKEIGIKPYPGQTSYEQSFEIKGRNGAAAIQGKNLIAYIPGKTENIIVISAHYDHVGVIKNEVFNGADDNASGSAALLKFAKYFTKNKPNNTLIFALFDGEEMGLQGAKAFVANPPVALSKIKLNINMDMISHNDKQELYAVGTFKYPELKPFLTTTNPNLKLLLGHDDPKLGQDDWTNQSDQGAFNAKNIPFIYFGVEDHKDYHKATDEYQNINKTFFIDAANAIQEVILNIDKKQDIQAIFKQSVQMKKQ